MFSIELFTFSKKENSTKQPNRADATSFNCIVKHGSGLLNPQIRLDIGLNQSPAIYNYCYIPDFDRYYWIEEWKNEHPLWIASLSVDVLASYKSEIGNTNLYVLRASNEYDGNVIDALYPTSTQSTKYIQNHDIFNTSIDDGVFILGVVNKYGSLGSIEYYAVKPDRLASLCYYLTTDAIKNGVNGFTADDCSIALQRSLIDPLSYIKSAVFLPIAYNSFWGQATDIDIMGWNCGVTGKIIQPSHDVLTLSHEFELYKHPQANSRGSFANVAPYSEYLLLCMPFGEISLDTLMLKNATSINVDIDIELHTGIGVMTITTGTQIINRLQGMIGTPIALSQINRDYLGGMQSALSSIGNITSAVMNPAGAVSGTIGAVNGIVDGIRAIQPRQSTTGNSGSLINYQYQIALQSRFFNLVDDDINCNGRPLCKIRKPNSIPGYMLIQDADVSIPGTSYELSKVRGYLEGGFYYE